MFPRREPSAPLSPWRLIPIVALIVAVTAVSAAAQEETPVSEPTETVPEADPGAGTLPDGTVTPVEEGVDPFATTTTEPFTDSFEGGNSAYGGQGPFDPASNAVLVDRLAEERGRLSELMAQRADLVGERDDVELMVALVEADIADREAREASSVSAAADARREATDAAVAAYVSGDDSVQLAGTVSDPVTYSRARAYLGALSGKRRDIAERYTELAADLDEEQRGLADELAGIRIRLASVEQSQLLVDTHIGFALQNIEALERGSHVVVDGLVFPVAGDVHYVDSWGFPRLPGTLRQHWHEGIDIMAPIGRELVATESGEITKVGVAGLGGDRLWLIGDSGVEYYYAHLSGYAEGIEDGRRVVAGEVIAYVGDTGGASGGPPHLHMQIHPDGGDPVNPFPVLAAARGEAPVLTQAEALAGKPLVLAGSVDAEAAGTGAQRPLVPWLVSPTDRDRSRLVTWTSMPR